MDRIDSQLDRLRDQLDAHTEIIASLSAKYMAHAESAEVLIGGLETRVKTLERIAYKTTALWAIILFICNAIGIVVVQFFIRHSTTP